MRNILFLENAQAYQNDSEFIVHLTADTIGGKSFLLYQLSLSLHFPEYFGHNWDALQDCLRDFHWIVEKGITLVHDELPMLEESTMRTYIDVLLSAVAAWKEGEEHYFKVIFPESAKRLVLACIEAQ
jgi:RNAse (barnase) inhibitor barstar